MSNILSVDPGISIGLAFCIESERTYVTWVTRDPKEVFDFFKDQSVIDIVITENFATRGKISRYGLHTTRLVGSMEALCHVRDIKFVRQQPQQRIAFVDLAKKIVNRQEGRVEDSHHHQADALAHLLRYQYDHGVIDGNGNFI